ncbi:hypothetical protein HBA53_21795 [Rhodococcus pyridinivorans]|uniref:hypothetical protein n=1 Tax=Rhodococcus TaxID=1827 RepID=UPI000EB0CCA2|nr:MULTISPECIES: hypothetical protein [Rhodococcus]MBX4170670.1 hypothetical protein [Rhodococcus sp. DMU2021]QXF83338.1 hypothetical protein HBA53_21795 [Rhodococcus pyridinivorans]
MQFSDGSDLRTYGNPRALYVIVFTAVVGLLFPALLVGVFVEQATAGMPLEAPTGTTFLLALGATVLVYPVIGFLMYSPRTRAEHIVAETETDSPALVLRQSPSVFWAAPAQIGMLTLMLLAAVWTTPNAGDRTSENVIMTIVICSWQVGFYFFVARRTLRPGRIALSVDGIRFSDHATDTWIPWNATASGVQPDPLYVVLVALPQWGAVTSARVPLPWRIIDDRKDSDLRPSPRRHPGHTARIDRRRFEIAPELLDAVLDHYLRDPDARAELADPDAVARRVDELRSYAPGPRWRRYGPVPVPTLSTPAPR